MSWPVEHVAAGVKTAIAFGVAGVSSATVLIADLTGAGVPAWAARLLDYGMAGLFILALIYAIKVLRADAAVLRADLEKKDGKIESLEKEIRDGLRRDLQDAHSSRQEMIRLMRKGDEREESKTS